MGETLSTVYMKKWKPSSAGLMISIDDYTDSDSINTLQIAIRQGIRLFLLRFGDKATPVCRCNQKVLDRYGNPKQLDNVNILVDDSLPTGHLWMVEHESTNVE